MGKVPARKAMSLAAVYTAGDTRQRALRSHMRRLARVVFTRLRCGTQVDGFS